METVNLSGKVLSSSDNLAITGLDLLIISIDEITRQYRTVTDYEGHFSIEIVAGVYDLYFSNNTHMPLIKAGVSIKQALSIEAQLNPIDPVAGKIFGQALLPGGGPASGYSVELLSGDAAESVAKVTCDNQGSFQFPNCAFGYFLIRISNASGKSITKSLPMPGPSMSFEVTLIDNPVVAKTEARTQHLNDLAYISFKVCKNSFRKFTFLGGVIPANTTERGSPMSIKGEPMLVNIYVGLAPFPYSTVYKYAVFADCRTAPPFAPAQAPVAQYYFWDKTKDVYSLTTFWPTLHFVSYNSPNPDIVKVTIQGLGVGDYWDAAAQCK